MRAAGRPAVGIIGPGRAGLGLALSLRRGGARVLGVHGRRRKSVPRGLALSFGGRAPWLRRADVILLAVRDDALPGLVRALSRERLAGRVVLHLSGSRTADALAPLRRAGAAVGAMHPLMTVSAEPRRAAERFRGATFVIDGDPAAARAARTLALMLGAIPARIGRGEAAKARYHAGAVFASNYVVVMMAVAESLLTAAGLARNTARRALAPLSLASLQSVAVLGPVRALTGPVARGDVATLRRHLAVLPRDMRRLYRFAAAQALVLARRAGLPAADARKVARTLGFRPDSPRPARPNRA